MVERSNPAKTTTHEQEFLQRYVWLKRWALHFTNNNPEQAEDLVHDVFVQFMLRRHDLEPLLQNLDGYLYTMLRNMHISEVRRANRLQASSAALAVLPLSDYDSAIDGLNAIKQRDGNAQEELYQICQYAYTRRHTSKAGSVLLLRFFHGYYPAEIALILRTTRASVDKWIQIARSEAKLYVSRSETLGFLQRNHSDRLLRPESDQSNEDFIDGLRSALLSPVRTECEEATRVVDLYKKDATQTLSSELLSHIVTCASCLSRVNEELHLSPLSDRHPSTTLGARKPPSKGGPKPPTGPGPTGGGSNDNFLAKAQRRLKEIFNHRPQQIRIAVDGFLMAAHDVTSEFNTQTLTIKDDDFRFVEVLSEQEVRLLFFNVSSPPEGTAQQRTVIGLSDDRSVELLVDYSDPRPTLRVVYHDPTFDVQLDTDTEDSFYNEGAPALDRGPEHTYLPRLQTALRRLLDREFWSKPPVLSFVITTALVIFVALASFHYYRRHQQPQRTLVLLLSASETKEQLLYDDIKNVPHRTIYMEERSPSTKSVLSRYRVESWHSAQKGMTVKRLYNEAGQLVAGNWLWSDQTETIYQVRERPRLRPSQSATLTPKDLDTVWTMDISTTPYLATATQDDREFTLAEDPTTYTINYERNNSTDEISLVKASLTLRKTDLHPINQTVILTAGGVTHEYYFNEASLELAPSNAVPPHTFIPEEELFSVPPPTSPGTNDIHVYPPPPLSSTPQPNSPRATLEMQVEALQLLHQVRADTDEQISTEITSAGQLQIKGVVETQQRKNEIVAGLQPLASNKAVQIQIQTVEDYLKRERVDPPIATGGAVQRYESAASTPPAADVIQRYLSKTRTPTSDDVNQYANRIVNQSRATMRHAGAIKRLSDQLPSGELDKLAPDARAKWLALLHMHIRNYIESSTELRAELERLYSRPAARNWPPPDATHLGTSDLTNAINSLYRTAAANDRKLRSAFTVSSDTRTEPSIDTTDFWDALLSAEAIARQIESST